MGLRGQILLALVLVTVGAIASVGAIAIWQTREALAAERIERVSSLVETAQLIAERSLGDGAVLADEARAERLALELSRAVGADEVVFFDAGGKKVAPGGAGELATDERGVAGALAGLAPYLEERPGDEDVRLLAYAAVRSRGRVAGVVRLTFTLDAFVDATLRRARNAVVLLGALGGLLLLVAAGWILRGAVVKPVRDLEVAARRVAGGDLEVRVEGRGPGELGRLADAFESMTASLRQGREQLIRSEKLASVGRLSAGIAHEVGNPLAAILGYVEMLQGETPERPIDPEMRADILSRVRSEIKRIDGIIKELLEYARPPDETEDVDVPRVVEAACSLARAARRSSQVALDVALPDGLPRVRGTANRLTQVLLNLIFNAADAMDGAGRIRIDARAAQGRVVLGVEDEGPGVAEDIRDRIFDPFFTTKDPGAGTGLGLAVSQSIVESYDGTLRLVGKNRFEITLPAA